MKGFLICLALGFLIRLVPEILSFPYPIGFDTVYYAARISSGVILPHWSSFFSTTWLLYALLVPVYQVVRGDPFLLMKLVAPCLFALNVGGIYYFARRWLSWEVKTAMIAAAFFSIQLAALRISWDLFRNVLGMGILLFTLPFIRKLDTKTGFTCFVLLSTLVVFSHETSFVIMFALVFGIIAKDLLKHEKVRALKVFVGVLPALSLFLSKIYLSYFPVSFVTESNVISVVKPDPHPAGLFFLVNYFKTTSSVQFYPSYLNLISDVFSLFVVLYLLSMPLIFSGFFRDSMLDSWAPLLLFCSFNALITPFFAVTFWNRWMFLLVYPFTFYAVNGIRRILSSKKRSKLTLKRLRVSKRIMSGILLLTVSLGALFMVMPVSLAVFSFSSTVTYLPSTMQHNTVPLQDVLGVTDSMQWLNGNMSNNSCLLVHHSLLWWAELLLENHTVIYFLRDTAVALDVAMQHGFDPIYLVWWNPDIGWYGFSVPQSFEPVFYSGRFSVFEFE